MFSPSYRIQLKSVFTVAYPVALSQLGHIAVGVADTIMAGRLPGPGIGAITIAMSIFIPLLMVVLGCSMGMSPMISRALGAKEEDKITPIFFHSLVSFSFLSFVLMGICMLLVPYLGWFNRDPEVVAMAKPFLMVTAVTLIPIMGFQLLRQLAEGYSNTLAATIISWSGNVLNIVLVIFTINGTMPLLPASLEGIAWASLIARFIMAFGMLGYIATQKILWRHVKGCLKEDLKPAFAKEVLVKSLPVGAQLALESAAFACGAFIIGFMDTASLEAHQIAINLASVTYMAASGIGAGAAVRVGFERGSNNRTATRQAGSASFLLVSIFMLACAVLFVLAKDWMPTIYTDDPEVIRIAIPLLLVTALFQLSDGIQVVAIGALRGLGDVILPAWLSFAGYWVIAMPLAYYWGITLGMGALGVWYGFTAGLFIVSIVLLLRFYKMAK